MTRWERWWIPGLFWAALGVAVAALLVPRERSASPEGSGAPTPVQEYRDYLTELVQTVLEFHPSLEGVEPRQFLARVATAFHAVAQEEADVARRGALSPQALRDLPSIEALASRIFPRQGIQTAQLDPRLHLVSQAVLEALDDPFTQLLEGDRALNLSLVLKGILPGTLGLFLDQDERGLWISIVLNGSVAYLAGLRPGDRILRIDGTAAAELSLRTARHAVESRCTLVVSRPGWDRAVELTLDPLPLANLEPQGVLLDGQVGYLRFGVFSGVACLGLQEEARKLESQGAHAFLLDVRGNPGGVIADALAIADMLLGPGLLITTLEQRPDAPPLPLPEEVWSSPRPWNSEDPLVLLVDRSSASASELLAETLKDHRRAFLVGETTYGKGVGQSAFPLMLGGKSLPRVDLLFLTCLRFHAPLGYNVHGVGVSPDLRVPAAEQSAARVAFRGKLLENHALLAELLRCELDPEDVQMLREAPEEVPEPLRRCAVAHGVLLQEVHQRAAYRDLARLALERRYPGLLACPVLDPVVAKGLRAAHVLLRD